MSTTCNHAFYFPTTLVLIDDNTSLLTNLSFSIGNDNAVKTFSQPQQALTYINQHVENNPLLSGLISDDESERYDHVTVDININNIQQILLNPQRFAQISLIISDYAMPGINGLDLCKQVSDPIIKKILLTGQADNELAIEGFNAGIIDQFIQKNNSDLIQFLTSTIANQQHRYFQALTAKLFHLEQLVNHASLNIITQPAFIDFFQELINKHHIIEYYLLDEHGSYLLLDEHANSYLLIIRNTLSIAEDIRLAEFEQAPKTIIDEIKNYQSLLYFPTLQAQEIPAAQWQIYLHPAKMLPTLDNYYYSFIEHYQHPEKHDIKSFDYYQSHE